MLSMVAPSAWLPPLKVSRPLPPTAVALPLPRVNAVLLAPRFSIWALSAWLVPLKASMAAPPTPTAGIITSLPPNAIAPPPWFVRSAPSALAESLNVAKWLPPTPCPGAAPAWPPPTPPAKVIVAPSAWLESLNVTLVLAPTEVVPTPLTLAPKLRRVVLASSPLVPLKMSEGADPVAEPLRMKTPPAPPMTDALLKNMTPVLKMVWVTPDWLSMPTPAMPLKVKVSLLVKV